MDYLINLCIAVFGSLSGAVAGCVLAHRYLRRKDEDAVRENKAIIEADDMRQALVALTPFHANDLDRIATITMNSGEQFFLQRIDHVGAEVSRITCTNEFSISRAVGFGKVAKGFPCLIRTREIASIIPDPKFASHLVEERDGNEGGDH